MRTPDRNYGTISPSARSLLLMKGLTDIPFARRAAELIMYPEPYQPDIQGKDMTFWARVVHFESRYWSIDQLLDGVPVTNILELSSGFSFRGLEITNRKKVHYIDTDLPEIIKTKEQFISSHRNRKTDVPGILETVALNALDKDQFERIADRFTPGEIVIVNEGLLMYLDDAEKKELCKIIHDILVKRGGYWITADVYVKGKLPKLNLKIDRKTKQFFEQHRIEENKFESFEDAESFFNKSGFSIDKEAVQDHSQLSTLPYLLQNLTKEQVVKMQQAGKIQATWRLKVENEN